MENDYPLYGRLTKILVVNLSSVMFNVCVLDTVTFLLHCNVYCVSPSSSHQVIQLSHLHSRFPMHIHHIVTSGVTKQVIVPSITLLVVSTNNVYSVFICNIKIILLMELKHIIIICWIWFVVTTTH